MRLPEDKIKQAILHPDLDVREAAIRYFYDSTTPDHTLMPLAIEAIETYGRTGAFSHTHYLNLLPQTEQTLAWVISEFQPDFEGPSVSLSLLRTLRRHQRISHEGSGRIRKVDCQQYSHSGCN